MTNPYIETAKECADGQQDPGVAAMTYAILAVAWELKQAREEREAEAEREEHRANVRARMER